MSKQEVKASHKEIFDRLKREMTIKARYKGYAYGLSAGVLTYALLQFI